MRKGGGRRYVLLVTGRPGSGKTTLVRRVAAALAGRRIGGFTTEEIRVGGERQGFRLRTFDGRQAVMAHRTQRGPHRVGRYGVDVAAIDALAGPALTAVGADLYLVDEIGKMECLSAAFVSAMRRLLDSGATVVATVAQRGAGFIAEVKARDDVDLWELTPANREALLERVLGWLEERTAA